MWKLDQYSKIQSPIIIEFIIHGLYYTLNTILDCEGLSFKKSYSFFPYSLAVLIDPIKPNKPLAQSFFYHLMWFALVHQLYIIFDKVREVINVYLQPVLVGSLM